METVKTKVKQAEFPVDEYFENFLFTTEGEVWVAYVLDRVYFPLNEPTFFKPYIEDGKELFSHDEYEYQMINIPQAFLLKDHIEKTKRDLVSGDHKKIGDYYFDQAGEILEEEINSSDYTTILLAKLTTTSMPVTPVEFIELWTNAVSKKARGVVTGGIETDQVAPSVFLKREELLYQDLMNYKHVRRPSEEELKRISYYFFHRNNKTIPKKVSDVEINEGYLDPDKRGFIKIEQLDQDHYMAFLPLIEMPASLMGSGFVYDVQTSCYFPIETQIRLSFQHKQKDRSHLRKMFKRIKGQSEEQDMADAELDDDEVILSGDIRLKKLNRGLKREEQRLVEMSLWFVISASNEDELKQRINHLKEVLKGTDYKIYQPMADQITLFYQSLLAAPNNFTDYYQKVTTGYVADLGLDLYRSIGNKYGFPLARIITQKKFRDVREAIAFSSNVVWFRPSLTKKNIDGSVHANGNTSITGPSGQGKSTLVKYIFLWMIFFDQKTLYIEPKNEMVRFMTEAKQLYADYPEFLALCNAVNFITLSEEEEYRGILDPLIFLPTEQAIQEAQTVLFILGEVNQDPQSAKKYKGIIIESIKEIIASDKKDNLTNVIQLIKKKDPYLGITLESFNDNIGKTIIGNDDSVAIDFNATVNVLGIQGLQLPTKEEMEDKKTELKPNQIASTAVMDVIMHTVNVFSTNKDEDGCIIIDEAKGFQETPRGKFLTDDSLRKGRANNTDTYVVQQSHSDQDDEQINDLISYKFAFRPNSKEQQKKVLEYFGMEPNKKNIAMIAGLVQGTCLFQDHLGRNQAIAVDVLFNEWLAAIKSTDDTNEVTKRALEMEKESLF